MNIIHLEPNMVPDHLKTIDGYNGKKFKAVVCTEMTVPITAGLWQGGSREYFVAVDFDSGRIIEFPNQHNFIQGRSEKQIELKPGFAVVEHVMSCGKDAGLTFYIHPDNASKMLPVPVTLDDVETHVLHATARYKASYMGRDRYAMAFDDWHDNNAPTRNDWDRAKTSLIEKGLLNKAGAITVTGKNHVK
jgi:hypothetical protein